MSALPTFPPSFAWGASTSSHQVEGGNVNNDWWHAEHSGNPIYTEPSGDACDSYHRWREDLDLLAGAGLNSYRFSLEWSRIEPAPGEFSAAAIDHYARLIDGCADRGLNVMLTLQHFTVPLWFGETGGWANDAAVDRFARYVEAVQSLYRRPEVNWVCTINEPNIAAIFSKFPTMPPAALSATIGLPEPDEQVTEALIRAHHRAREIIRADTAGAVGWSVANQPVTADPGCEDLADAYRHSREDQFLEPAGGDEFIGVQAYTRTLIGPDGPRKAATGTTTLTGWEYYPNALGDAISHTWEQLPGIPIIVTENGIATDDDQIRIEYTRGALAGMGKTMADGADVRGYLHWSLLDNFEWFAGYRPTFGLIAVDRNTFVRTPKPSLQWLGSIARTGKVS